MKTLNKYILLILVLLLIVTSTLILKTSAEKKVLQKNIDNIYINAISDSMDGLTKDYNLINTNEKIELYYKTLSNLRDALDVFYFTSYKEYNDLFITLNNLYIYLLENRNESYEINNNLYIQEFLGTILVSPDDKQKINDFNNSIGSKK